MSAPTTEAEFWHVQLPSGEVRYWSLEELDEAFQRDEVTAKTYVLKEGTTTWQSLGELLGLDEAADVVHVAVAPYNIGGSQPPPSSQSYLSEAPGPNTMRPVVADVEDLDDDQLVASMRPKKKNMAVILGGAGAALLLAIVGLSSLSGSSDAPVAAAAQPPPPVPVVTTPAPDPAPATPAVTLSDDVKQKLLSADKAREAKAAARAAENAKYRQTVTSYRAPKSGQVFHKGGNKYDPLSN